MLLAALENLSPPVLRQTVLVGYLAAAIGAGALVLLPVLLLSLIQCFLGYVLFRLQTVLVAVVLGVILGAWLVGEFRLDPGRMDYFIGCLAGALVLGVAAWVTPQAGFAVTSGLAACRLLVDAVVILGGDSPPGVGTWTLGALTGLAVGAVAMRRTRRMIFVLFGLAGGTLSVACVATMVAGSPGRLGRALLGPDRQGWLIAVFLVAAGLVSAVGMFAQMRLAAVLRDTFTLDELLRRSGKRRSRSVSGRRRSPRIRPRLR